MKQSLKHFSLLFFFALVIFYPTLHHLYLDIDEVLWAEFAHAVLNGCAPYVCVIGEKPPLLYLTYAAVFKIFGANNYFVLHLFHIVWVSLTAFLLCVISNKVRDPEDVLERSTGPLTNIRGDNFFLLLPGLIYILLFALPEFRTLAATGESFGNLFLIVALYLFIPPAPLTKGGVNLSNPPLVRGVGGIGLLIGIASLYRHQAAIQILPFLFLSKGLRPKFFLILGMLSTWALMGFVLWLWGAWPAFWEWGILHNFGYIQNGVKAPGVWLTALENLGLFFGKTSVFWILAFYSRRSEPVCSPANCGQTRGSDPTILYLSAALLAACTGFRFFPHYFIQAYPPLALLAVLGLQKINFPLWTKIGLSLSLVLVLFQNFTLSKTLENDSTKDYNSLNKRVGKYIGQHTKPEDKIIVWGWGQGIYAYANRRMGTRYIASDFLTGRIPASDAKQYSSIEEAQKFVNPKAWEYFFEDMEKNRPLYFINTSIANMHDYQRFPPDVYPSLKRYLAQYYFLENNLEQIEIYRRK